MRLTNACILAIPSTSGSVFHGFQLTASPRIRSYMQVSATIDEAITETPSPIGSSSMCYADVTKLTFCALQQESKSLGLSAIGTKSVLQGRLLGHFGLTSEETVVVEAPKTTAAKIEVSYMYG